MPRPLAISTSVSWKPKRNKSDAVIKTKSVFSPIDKRGHGFRILVTRIRSRGQPKSRYDEWMASLVSTEELLESFRRGDENWSTFARQYRRELFDSSIAFD